MKRLLALLLLVSMTLLFSAPSMAEDISTETGSSTKPVTVTRVDVPSDIVYSVSIVWGNMNFEYRENTTGNWNPADHSFVNSGNTAVWVALDNGNHVRVINHSNTAMKAVLSYTPYSDFDMVTGSFDNAAFTLPSAVGVSYGNAPRQEAILTLSGTLPEGTATSQTQIGTVRVSISPA